jgi:plastocyanin
MTRPGTLRGKSPALGAATLAALAVLAGGVAPGRQGSLLEDPVVEMTGSNTFEPKYLTVKAGQTVLWKNLSDRSHAVATDGNLPRRNLPAGAQPLRSGDVAPQGTFAYRFTTAGTYRYACPQHRDAGMTGTIFVKP